MPERRYNDEVPHTLDLAERATAAINCLTGALDPDHDYEIYSVVRFCTNPVHMVHDATGWPKHNPKCAESLPMLRLMTGSDQNVDAERRMRDSMVAAIRADGLYYAEAGPRRPWHEGLGQGYLDGTAGAAGGGGDFASIAGNARMALAMMVWDQLDDRPAWRKGAGNLVRALVDISVDRGEYAYYPEAGLGEAFSYPASGWSQTDAPATQPTTAVDDLLACHGAAIRSLARWACVSGDERALECAAKLVKFVMRPGFWGVPAFGPDAPVNAGKAHFIGDHHARAVTLRALLEYALLANDARIKEFVRGGYEYARGLGEGADRDVRRGV